MKKLTAVLSLIALLCACSLLDEDSGEPSNPDTNEPPTVVLVASPTRGSAPLNVTLTATAADPDGDELSYRWSLAGLPDAASVTTQLTEAGEYPISVTVSDGENEASASTTVTVAGDTPVDPEPPTDPEVPTESQLTVETTPGGPAPWAVRYNYAATGFPEGSEVSFDCNVELKDYEVVKYAYDQDSIACLHLKSDERVEVTVYEPGTGKVLATKRLLADLEPAGDVAFAGTWRHSSNTSETITFTITQPHEGGIGGSDETGTHSIYYGKQDDAGLLNFDGNFYLPQPLDDGTQRFVSYDGGTDEPATLEKID